MDLMASISCGMILRRISSSAETLADVLAEGRSCHGPAFNPRADVLCELSADLAKLLEVWNCGEESENPACPLCGQTREER